MFLKFLKPPRFETVVVARFPTKIDPDGKARDLTPQQQALRQAYLAEQTGKVMKQFRRKQIVYWSVVGFMVTLAALAVWLYFRK